VNEVTWRELPEAPGIFISSHYREIPGYPGYHVSRNGNVLSTRQGVAKDASAPGSVRILKPSNVVVITNKDGQRAIQPHRLVAVAFLGLSIDPQATVAIRFANGNPADIRPENLVIEDTRVITPEIAEFIVKNKALGVNELSRRVGTTRKTISSFFKRKNISTKPRNGWNLKIKPPVIERISPSFHLGWIFYHINNTINREVDLRVHSTVEIKLNQLVRNVTRIQIRNNLSGSIRSEITE